jgi:hypothetical protein
VVSDDRHLAPLLGTKYALTGVLAAPRPGVLRFRGEHTGIGRPIEALVLDPDLELGGAESAWLLRLARTLGAASHPGLQSLLDSGLGPGDRPYLVFEEASGESVADLVKREGPFTVERAGQAVLVVLESLWALHQSGSIARTLGPENFTLTRRGEGEGMKLRHLYGAVSRSEVGETPAAFSPWAAPEVRRNEAVIDVTADLYSVGALLRFLLTGQTGTRASAARTSLPDAARRAFERAMRDAPDQRFPTADVFMQAVSLLVPRAGAAPEDAATPDDPLVADLSYLLARRSTRHGSRHQSGSEEGTLQLLPVLLAVEASYRLLGPSGWSQLVEAMPEVERLLPAAGQTPHLLAAGVPVVTFEGLLRGTDRGLGVGPLGSLPRLAEAAVKRGLGRAFPGLPERLGLDALIEGFPYLWSQFATRGTASVEERDERSAVLAVRGQGAPSIEATGFVAALLRAALRTAGHPDAEVSVSAAQALGDRTDLLHVRW